MSFLKKIQKNAFPLLIVFLYLGLFIFKPSLGEIALKNSKYFIKEMLLIMPVIFILTALLDMWVSKDNITKFLGKEAKAKGTFLAFVVGSISAGPIYAAFPMGIMLYKKGASIRNIIIILSSWAVIKVPMLLNEMKFLGLKFMAIRWALTVIAILIFSHLAALLIKKEDLPFTDTDKPKLQVSAKICKGCSLCIKKYPNYFIMQDGKAIALENIDEDWSEEYIQEIISICPFNAISYY